MLCGGELDLTRPFLYMLLYISRWLNCIHTSRLIYYHFPEPSSLLVLHSNLDFIEGLDPEFIQQYLDFQPSHPGYLGIHQTLTQLVVRAPQLDLIRELQNRPKPCRMAWVAYVS